MILELKAVAFIGNEIIAHGGGCVHRDEAFSLLAGCRVYRSGMRSKVAAEYGVPESDVHIRFIDYAWKEESAAARRATLH